MIGLIPPQYRLLAAIIGLAVALTASAAAGAVVNGWRLDADHQRAMTAKQGEYDALASIVREQNRGLETLAAAGKAAVQRRELAEKYASGIIGRIGSRSDAVAASKEKDCDGVMREAWRNWK